MINILLKISILPPIMIIRAYQLILSPILKTNCRYLPTCSEYSLESLKKHGLLRGCYLSFKRILHCHPLGGDGYDPVPEKTKKRT